MKQDKNKWKRNIANKIVKLEKERELGASDKYITKEIEEITSKLSISDMLWIDEYIMLKKLLK